MSTLSLEENQVEQPSSSELEKKEGEYVQNLKRMVVGSGDQVVKVDENGLFAGNANFADAPFSVDFDGNLIATNGRFSGSMYIGAGSNVHIDGANKRILINDGTNDRVLIGFGSGLF